MESLIKEMVDLATQAMEARRGLERVAFTTELDVFLPLRLAQRMGIDRVGAEVAADAISEGTWDWLKRSCYGLGWDLRYPVTIKTSDSVYHLTPRFYSSHDVRLRLFAPAIRWEMTPVIAESKQRCEWVANGTAFKSRRDQYLESLKNIPLLELDPLESDAIVTEYIQFTRKVRGKGGMVKDHWLVWEAIMRVIDKQSDVAPVMSVMDTTCSYTEIPMMKD